MKNTCIHGRDNRWNGCKRCKAENKSIKTINQCPNCSKWFKSLHSHVQQKH